MLEAFLQSPLADLPGKDQDGHLIAIEQTLVGSVHPDLLEWETLQIQGSGRVEVRR